MRIAVIVPEFPCVTQTFTYIRLGTLAAKGVKVNLFYSKQGDLSLLDSKLVKRMLVAGVEYTNLPGDRLGLVTFFKLLFSRSILRNLTNATKYFCKLLQSHPVRKAGSALLRFAPILFWHPDLIHIETSYLLHGMLKSLEGMEKPVLISLRGADVDEKPAESKIWRDFFTTTQNRPLVHFHCVSEHIRETAVGLGVPKEKCITIYSGIIHEIDEQDIISSIPELEISKIITVARLSREKGIDLALQAISHLHESGLMIPYNIIGDGPERESLENQVKQLKLQDHVFFGGAKNNDWVRDYLSDNSSNSIYLQPSRFEAFGLSILEALFSGLPVVTTNVGGIPEIIRDGITGLLCEPDNPVSIAEKIKQLMQNKELREKIRSKGYEVATNEFSEDAEAEKFINLFTRLISKQSFIKK